MKRKLSFGIVFLILVAIFAFAGIATATSDAGNKLTQQQTSCDSKGGLWRELNSGCGDDCGTENAMCTSVLLESCDCGIGRCWAGLEKGCIPGKSAQDPVDDPK